MKYLIVGLGNPGAEYIETRHNIGFKIADELVCSLKGSYKQDKLADIAYLKYKSRNIIVIKPSTFMNLSGKAVNYWMVKEKINIENVLILTDDLSLPFGKIRLKGKGSDGGHNGLKSIQETINTSKYSRLRFGIGNNFMKGQQVSYVLGKWHEEQSNKLEERILISADCIKSFCTIGLDRSMSNWNNK